MLTKLNHLNLTLFRPAFFWSLQTGGGIPPPLRTCNFQNILVCPKIYLFVYVTWDDDLTSRDNYTIMQKQPPSWISKFFQNVRKPANKNVLKTRKKVKLTALITKITCLSKCRYHGDIKFLTQQLSTLPIYFQINFR